MRTKAILSQTKTTVSKNIVPIPTVRSRNQSSETTEGGVIVLTDFSFIANSVRVKRYSVIDRTGRKLYTNLVRSARIFMWTVSDLLLFYSKRIDRKYRNRLVNALVVHGFIGGDPDPR